MLFVSTHLVCAPAKNERNSNKRIRHLFQLKYFSYIYQIAAFFQFFSLLSLQYYKKVHVNLFIQKCIKSKGSYNRHNKNTKTGRHATILLPIFLYIFIYVDQKKKKKSSGTSIWTPALRLERILMHKQMAKLILIWLDWHCRHTHEYNGVHRLKPTAQDNCI